jgi:hypothetical protein
VSLHPKQQAALRTKATEVLYGGSAGGGKSHLIRVTAIMFCYYVPGVQVYLFRRHYADLYKNHMDGAGSFPQMLATMVDSGEAKIIMGEIEFKNGSKIHLCHCQHDSDVTKYQGAEIHVLLMDELTHFSEKVYRFLRGRCRIGGLQVPEQFAGKLPMILCGSNPGGIGHNWVRATFVSAAPPMDIIRQGKLEGGMLRQFIPAKLEDNPTLTTNDPDYLDRLEGLGDAALVKAMRDGDWNIVSGGALDDVWTPRVTVPRFTVPSSWRVDRSFDWGSTHPFSVLWWAESDGTEAAMADGSKFSPPRGSLVLMHEWYGSVGPNQGLKMSPRDVAKGIVEREAALIAGAWISGAPKPGPADNQIDAVSQPGTPTIAGEMASEGVKWTASDKAPGSRKIGLELMRSRLRESGKERPEHAALYVMAHCINALSNWPVLPRDPRNPDDVDTNAVDHDYDSARYRVLAAKRQTAQLRPIRGLA